MPDLCIIITCMGRLAHLRQTLPSKVQQANAACVVVDYSCPEQCGAWVESNFPGVRVVRVPGQACFNLAHARNVGVRAADAPWLCFVDADVALDAAFTQTVLPTLQAGHFYQPQPHGKQLGGQVICARVDFDRIEGCDEVIRTYGEEDSDFYRRLTHAGVRLAHFPAQLLRAVAHDDTLRQHFAGGKTLGESIAINRIYGLAKFDLMRLTGKLLTLAEREEIDRKAKQVVANLVQTGRPDSFQVKFQQDIINNRALLECSLHCKLHYLNDRSAD